MSFSLRRDGEGEERKGAGMMSFSLPREGEETKGGRERGDAGKKRARLRKTGKNGVRRNTLKVTYLFLDAFSASANFFLMPVSSGLIWREYL